MDINPDFINLLLKLNTEYEGFQRGKKIWN